MNLNSYDLIKTTIEYDEKKKQYQYLKNRFLHEVKKFFNDCITIEMFNIETVIDHKNPILIFTTLEEIPPKMMLDFCNEFEFYSPTVKYTESYGFRIYTFKKKIDWTKI